MTRTSVLVALVVITGVAGGGLWYARQKSGTPPTEAPTEQAAGYALSDGTKTVLNQLQSPVEIRFYALLDSTYAPESVQVLAGHADEMLTAFAQAAGGKLTIKRLTTLSSESENAAAKEGLKALDLAQGNPNFLGLAVVGRDKKETLPLLPEWEPAMEFDLARALARVSAVPAQAKTIPADPKAEARISAEINRLVPDLKTTSVADGIVLLRASAMSEFKVAAAEMKTQVEAAQQRLSEALSATDKAAALKQLQQVQLEQGEQLKAIAARLQDEIEQFQKLKAAPGN